MVIKLKEALDRVESWPEAAQEELAAVIEDIERGLRAGAYHPTADELAGIDRGRAAAAAGRFAADGDIRRILRPRGA